MNNTCCLELFWCLYILGEELFHHLWHQPVEYLLPLLSCLISQPLLLLAVFFSETVTKGFMLPLVTVSAALLSVNTLSKNQRNFLKARPATTCMAPVWTLYPGFLLNFKLLLISKYMSNSPYVGQKDHMWLAFLPPILTLGHSGSFHFLGFWISRICLLYTQPGFLRVTCLVIFQKRL